MGLAFSIPMDRPAEYDGQWLRSSYREGHDVALGRQIVVIVRLLLAFLLVAGRPAFGDLDVVHAGGVD